MIKSIFSHLIVDHLSCFPSRRFLLKASLATIAPALLMLSGCSGPMVLHNTVGPGPSAFSSADVNGRLQVFTSTEGEETVGFSFAYKQRTAYTIYAKDGKEFKHVGNNTGHYDDTPQVISLPPGTYSIKGFMSEGLGQLTVVSVEIEAGRKTEVYLDGQWPSPDLGDAKQLVRAPNGFVIGWLAQSATLTNR